MEFSLFEVWPDVAAGVVLAVVAYGSTNVDNLLLMASVSARRADRRAVVLGFLLSTVAVLGLSAAFVVVSEAFSPRALGLLGFVPVFLGVKMLLDLWKEPSSAVLPAVSVLPMGLALLGNSTDTISVFGPLVAESKTTVLIAMLLAFLVMAAIWILLALRLSARLVENKNIGDIARWVTPFVMILLGVYILLDTTTDLFVGL